MKSDLVDHSNRNLQDVGNVDHSCGRCLKCQTKVMNHHLDVPWVGGRNLGARKIQHLGLERALWILVGNNQSHLKMAYSNCTLGLLEQHINYPFKAGVDKEITRTFSQA